ncbi:MAG: Hsp20/alpha crystallin family protein [Halococcoides sp.]
MRRDDRDDPFEDLFEDIERMMNNLMGADFDMNVEHYAGPGTPEAGHPAGQDVTDAHVDIYEEEEILRLVADLPGVEQSDIDLRCDGDVVTIQASGDRHAYDERVRLPTSVDETSASATYNNGILEVEFDRADDPGASIDLS